MAPVFSHKTIPPSFVLLFASIALLGSAAVFARANQQDSGLSGVHSIYVAELSGKAGAAEFRRYLIADLKRMPGVKLADSADHADAVLSGTGDLWIKGYYSTNPRVRAIGQDAQPIYGGYLSIELKDQRKETLWSYLSTQQPRSAGGAAGLAAEAVKHLGAALAKKR